MYFWIVLGALFITVASVGMVYWYASYQAAKEDKAQLPK
jgi:hypothetical protein